MLKLKELDATKYYYRVICKASGNYYDHNSAVEADVPIVVIQDVLTGKVFQIKEEVYDNILSDDTIVILGQKRLKRLTTTVSASQLIIGTAVSYDNVTSVLAKRQFGDIDADSINGKIDGEHVNYTFQNKLIQDRVSEVIDEYTVDRNGTYTPSAADALVKIEGVDMIETGVFAITKVTAKCITVNKEARIVIINLSNIDELIIPETCKCLMGVKSNIRELHCGGLNTIAGDSLTINKIHVTDSLRTIYGIQMGRVTLGEIDGKLRLNNIVDGYITDIRCDSELDLRYCKYLKDSISLECSRAEKIILPESVKRVSIGQYTKLNTLEVYGDIEHIIFGNSLTLPRVIFHREPSRELIYHLIQTGVKYEVQK